MGKITRVINSNESADSVLMVSCLDKDGTTVLKTTDIVSKRYADFWYDGSGWHSDERKF